MANNQRNRDRQRAQVAAAINPAMTVKGQQVGTPAPKPPQPSSGNQVPQQVEIPWSGSSAPKSAAPGVSAPQQQQQGQPAGGVTYGQVSWNSNDPGSFRKVESASPITSQPSAVPEFDWNAWNAEMMARQQAVWESMDAMNSAFLSQMESIRATPQRTGGGITGVAGAQDAAAVKIKKRTKKTSTTNQATAKPQATGLGIGDAGGATNGLGISKQDK